MSITKRQVGELLTLASVLDKREVNNPTVNLWHEIIGHYNWDQVHAAFLAHVRNSRFPVQPADIVHEIRAAHERHIEVYGLHPKPPEGTRWAVDAIMNDPEYDDPKAIEA